MHGTRKKVSCHLNISACISTQQYSDDLNVSLSFRDPAKYPRVSDPVSTKSPSFACRGLDVLVTQWILFEVFKAVIKPAPHIAGTVKIKIKDR
jgi:hypothetical protein